MEIIRVKEADSMPFERWTAYLWCIMICEGLVSTHYITKDKKGRSFIKTKQR